MTSRLYALDPLSASGWLDWSDARQQSAGFTWLWWDPDGLHQAATLPTEPPYTTHVWGWADGAWARWRLHRRLVVGAVLREGDGSGAKPDQAVTVVRREAHTWRDGDGRSAVDRRWRDLNATLLHVTSPLALTFLSLPDLVTG